MRDEPFRTHHKALSVNLDANKFGSFAEIGAGQEVVRWFFQAGKASSTVAKSISAYDTAVSNELYGPAGHYVSRQRLESMLDREYEMLCTRLAEKRGSRTSFFVFADTVATRSRRDHPGGHGWIGVRFQPQPLSEPSDIVAHVQLLDAVATAEQAALGALGVNLIYGAFAYYREPEKLIQSLMEGLRPGRVEVDVIKFSGPAFADVDNRLMSLQLVQQGLTDAAMFTVEGDVAQPSEVLSGKPVLIERGAFRPVTNVTLEMLDSARHQLSADPSVDTASLVAVMEMTLNNLTSERVIDHQDFLARVDALRAIGKSVIISNYTRYDRVSSYLRKYTDNWIVMVMGAPTLCEVFDEKYYTDLEGGLLEGLGRLFRGRVKLLVYPTKTGVAESLIDVATLEVAPQSQPLYEYLRRNGQIEAIQEFREDQLHIYPGAVLAQIRSGDSQWEKVVPAPVAQLIKDRRLFGYVAAQ